MQRMKMIKNKNEKERGCSNKKESETTKNKAARTKRFCIKRIKKKLCLLKLLELEIRTK